MESPIPILPLPTPDAETEKLIRMKDEEVGGDPGEEPNAGGRSQVHGGGTWAAWEELGVGGLSGHVGRAGGGLSGRGGGWCWS